MLPLLIISVLILSSSAKLLFSSDSFGEVNFIQPKREPVSLQVQFANRGDPLWVLSLSGDDWLAPKLRLGNTQELEEFFTNIGPSLRRSRRRPPLREKKDDSERQKYYDDLSQRPINDVKRDFMKLINKFAMIASVEPDAYITDNTHEINNSPSIKLNFKGPYIVLIVELGNKVWQYIINSPSLPGWFNERHDTRDSPILIPDDVKTNLFSSLFRLLHIFFGFPV